MQEVGLPVAVIGAGFSGTAKRREVQRLLDEGVGVVLDARWDAIAAAAATLAVTPVVFGAAQVARLRAAGRDDAAIVDVINGASFFNWTNRLMLSPGQAASRPS